MNYTSTLTSWEALTLLFNSRTNMHQRPHSEAVRPGKLAARLKPRRTTPPFLWSSCSSYQQKDWKIQICWEVFKVEIFQQTLPFRNPSPNRVSGPFRKQLDIPHSLNHNQTKKGSRKDPATEWQFPRVPMRFLDILSPKVTNSTRNLACCKDLHRLIEATSQTKWKCCGFWFRSSQLAFDFAVVFCSTGLSATFRSRFFFGFLGITTAFFFEPAMTKWLRTNALIWGKPCPTKDKHCPKNFVGLRHSDSFNSSKCRYTADILSNSWLSCIVFSNNCSSNIDKIILTKKKLKRRMDKNASSRVCRWLCLK